jgi:2-keto-4-pentenoate hydratase
MKLISDKTEILNYLEAIRSGKAREKLNFSCEYGLSSAYEMQNSLVESLNKSVGGWKIGGSNFSSQKVFNSKEIFYGPIFKQNIYFKKDLQRIDWNFPGEIEICFKIKKDINQVDLNNKLSLIDSISIGIEFPQSSFVKVSNLSSLISDLCSSGSLLVLKETPFRDLDFCEPIELSIFDEKKRLYYFSSKNLLKDPLNIFKDFLSIFESNNGTLTGGEYIATGGISDCFVFPHSKNLSIKSNIFPTISFSAHG